MKAEGWYLDPYRAHESRWFSDGWPTGLVRDGEVESFDIPPSPTWDAPVAAVPAPAAVDGEDLQRADEPLPDLTPYAGAKTGFRGSILLTLFAIAAAVAVRLLLEGWLDHLHL